MAVCVVVVGGGGGGHWIHCTLAHLIEPLSTANP